MIKARNNALLQNINFAILSYYPYFVLTPRAMSRAKMAFQYFTDLYIVLAQISMYVHKVAIVKNH